MVSHAIWWLLVNILIQNWKKKNHRWSKFRGAWACCAPAPWIRHWAQHFCQIINWSNTGGLWPILHAARDAVPAPLPKKVVPYRCEGLRHIFCFSTSSFFVLFTSNFPARGRGILVHHKPLWKAHTIFFSFLIQRVGRGGGGGVNSLTPPTPPPPHAPRPK